MMVSVSHWGLVYIPYTLNNIEHVLKSGGDSYEAYVLLDELLGVR